MITLRPHQEAAVNSVYDYWKTRKGNPLVVMATGTGKAYSIAALVQSVVQQFDGTRVLMLTHVKELIEQNTQSLITYWPQVDVGVYSASLNSRQLSNSVVFAGIQSIYKRAAQLGFIDLVMVDEAHTISRNANSMYGQFLDDLKKINPDMKVIGFTATPYRLQCGMLHEGSDALFDGICYEYNVIDAIRDGWLCEVRTKDMQTKIDVSGVAKRGGEFVAGALEAAVDTDAITLSAVKEMLQHGADRKSWIVFCAGVDHAEHVAEALRAVGVSTEVITGKTPKSKRAAVLAAYKSGQIKAVCNVGVLTTGFDAPATDMIVSLRPTQSPGLWVQQIGRGMRLADGKSDCLVLDFAGNTERHGPIDKITAKDRRGSGNGEAPIKVCPECSEILFAGLRICPNCEYEFPPNEISLTRTASDGALLSTQKKDKWLDVTAVGYGVHMKIGKPDSMKATYHFGLSTKPINHWVCFDHGGRALSNARAWWSRREVGVPFPRSTEEALARIKSLPKPKRVMVVKDGKYWKVEKEEF